MGSKLSKGDLKYLAFLSEKCNTPGEERDRRLWADFIRQYTDDEYRSDGEQPRPGTIPTGPSRRPNYSPS